MFFSFPGCLQKRPRYIWKWDSPPLSGVPPAKRLIGSRQCKCRPGPRIHLQRRYYERAREGRWDRSQRERRGDWRNEIGLKSLWRAMCVCCVCVCADVEWQKRAREVELQWQRWANTQSSFLIHTYVHLQNMLTLVSPGIYMQISYLGKKGTFVVM